jgi:hypothetical protein
MKVPMYQRMEQRTYRSIKGMEAKRHGGAGPCVCGARRCDAVADSIVKKAERRPDWLVDPGLARRSSSSESAAFPDQGDLPCTSCHAQRLFYYSRRL